MTHKFDANLLKYYDYVVDANSFIFMFEKVSNGNYKYKDNIKTIYINNDTYTLSSLLAYYADVTPEDSVTIDINNVVEIYIENDAKIIINGITTSFLNQTILPIPNNIHFKLLENYKDIPDPDEFIKILKVNLSNNGFELKSFSDNLGFSVVTDFSSPNDLDLPSTLASKTYIDTNLNQKESMDLKSIGSDSWDKIETDGFYTDTDVNKVLNDYFIPSKNEFNKITENLNDINLTGQYWTSSEKEDNTAYIKTINAPNDGLVVVGDEIHFGINDKELLSSISYTPNASIHTIETFGNSTNIYIGGDFTLLDATSRTRFAELILNKNTNQFELSGLDIAFNDIVKVIKITPDNKYMLIGGNFTSVNSDTSYKYIIRLKYSNTGWIIDSTFKPSINGSVNTIMCIPDGSGFFIGGNFTIINSIDKSYIAKFDVNGENLELSNWNLNITGEKVNSIDYLYTLLSKISNVSAGSSDYTNSFGNSIVYNNNLYFQGNNDTIYKIYKYDGTEISEISVGTSDYVYRFIYPIVYNNNLYFYGNNGTVDKIYKYDGTEISNVSAGSSDYTNNFSYPIVYNNNLYFMGNNSTTFKIYKYDGTEISNVSAGSSDYTYNFLDPIVYNNNLYFKGNNGTVDKIYKYNGIEISNVSTGSSDYVQYFSDPILYNNNLYFYGNNGTINKIYKYDGIEISEISVGTSDYTNNFLDSIVYNNNLYFKGFNGITFKIYKYDGTEISNVSVGSSDYVYEFVYPIVYNNNLYFYGYNGTISKIYKYDGTEISNVSAGSSDYVQYFSDPIVYNNNLYFKGDNGTTSKIYKYNGIEISNVSAGSSDYTHNFSYPIVYNNNLYFQGYNSTISKIYKIFEEKDKLNILIGGSFQTINGYLITNLAKLDENYIIDSTFSLEIKHENCIYNITEVGSSDYVYDFTYPILYNNNLYFKGYNSTISKIYKYDGTEISNVSAGSSDYTYNFSDPIVYNNNLYFYGNNGTIYKIYKYDGIEISEISVGTSDYTNDFFNPIVYNNNLYFQGYNGTIYKIYKYDGIEISNVSAGSSDYVQYFYYPIVYNNNLYFKGSNGTVDKIYKYDGIEISNVSVGSSDYVYDFSDPIVYNNNLYFTGYNGTIFKIYKYDGTEISEISVGTSDYVQYLYYPIVYNNNLYFTGNNGTKNLLYKYDGIEISNVSAGSSDYDNTNNIISYPIVYNGNLYFKGGNGTVDKIYKYDDTEISNVSAGSSDYTNDLYYPIVYNNNLYFAGYNGTVDKIYKYDGTEISNVSAGSSDYTYSFYSSIVYNGNLYFAGYNGTKNLLYKYDSNSTVSINKVKVNRKYNNFAIAGYFNLIDDNLFDSISIFGNNFIIDNNFNFSFNNIVNNFSWDNESIYIIGEFTSITNNINSNELIQSKIVKINFNELDVFTFGVIDSDNILPNLNDIKILDYDRDYDLKNKSYKVQLIRKFISNISYSLGEDTGNGYIFYIIDNGNSTYTYYEIPYNNFTEMFQWAYLNFNTNLGTDVDDGESNSALMFVDSNFYSLNNYKEIKSLKSPVLGKDFYGIVFSNTNKSQLLYAGEDEYIRVKENGIWSKWENNIEEKWNKLEEYQEVFNKPLDDLLFSNINLIDYSENILSFNCTQIIYAEDINTFIATDLTDIYYSKDGINFILVTNIISGSWDNLIYGKELGIIVAISQSGYSVFSYDGINWYESNFENNSATSSLVYNSKLKMFICFIPSEVKIVYSYDGVHWSKTEVLDNALNSISYGNNRFLSLTDYSINGIKWIPMLQTLPNATMIFWDEYNKRYIAFKQNGAYISQDLISWSEAISTNNNSVVYHYIKELNLFLSFISGYLYFSRDGIKWYKKIINNITNVTSIIYSKKLNKIFIASGTTSYLDIDLNSKYNKLFED